MAKDTQRLRIALQKSGRLHEESMAMFKLCGIRLSPGSRQLLYRSNEMPLDLLFIRDDDIPRFVAEGICDLGVVGENIYWEEKCSWDKRHPSPFQAAISEKLGFSHCRLSLAGPKEFVPLYEKQGSLALHGLTIATSYPASLGHFLSQQGVQAEIVEMNGSVELAPKLRIADLICDLISTGSTLVANNLVEFHSFLKSEAVLLENHDSKDSWTEPKQACFAQLRTRLKSVLRARNSKYVMMNAPKDKIAEISRLLPGMDSPTIIPLGDLEQVAIHVVSVEPVVWETMEALKAAGAHSILIQPIEKMLL
ncbi:MAG: ATP phosphoribosyltransferase [Spirochaetota bacterium]